MDRVAQRLHRESFLFQSGETVKVRRRSQRNHEVLIIDLVLMTFRAVDDVHPPGWKINGLNFAVEKPDFLKHFADRIHDVGDIQVAGGHFVQHGRKQEKVLAINKCDLEVRVTGHRLLQLERGVQPAEAPAQYQNPSWPVRTHQRSLRSAKHRETPVAVVLAPPGTCLEETRTPNCPITSGARREGLFPNRQGCLATWCRPLSAKTLHGREQACPRLRCFIEHGACAYSAALSVLRRPSEQSGLWA